MKIKNKSKLSHPLILLLFCSLLLMTGCNNTKTENDRSSINQTEQTSQSPLTKYALKLNTAISITLYDSSDESIINKAFELCDYYENLFSRTIETSEIFKINTSPLSKISVSPDTYELLEIGLKYSKLSEGAFDIAIEPLTSLWNFGSDNQKVPSKEDITQAISNINYKDISLSDGSITLQKEGMGIDLGAIAKGYIADKIKQLLLDHGVKSALINLGGNVLCVGSKPDGSAFKIGIQKPFEDRNETIAIMALSDVSVVSSGIYERYFVEDGVSYHHILNPMTGYPYDNSLISVTVISNRSVDGDCLSTTLFALGLEDGLKLVNSLKNTYAVFITDDYELHYSDGFAEHIKIVEE